MMDSYRDTAEAYDLLQAGRGRSYEDHAESLTATVRALCPSASSLLDVACGTGAHLDSFRSRFDEVGGLDLSEAMLGRARARLPEVDLRIGDMRDFDFGRTFDVVTCLFSSVGYMLTISDLKQAVRNLARHLTPGGVLVIEPWLHPDAWRMPHVTAEAANRPGMAVARASTTDRQGHVSSFTLYWTIATFEGVEHVVEHHELGLYEIDEYRDAFVAAGMSVEHDPIGLIGRGLFVGLNHT